jgi:hypothetical protein
MLLQPHLKLENSSLNSNVSLLITDNSNASHNVSRKEKKQEKVQSAVNFDIFNSWCTVIHNLYNEIRLS